MRALPCYMIHVRRLSSTLRGTSEPSQRHRNISMQKRRALSSSLVFSPSSRVWRRGASLDRAGIKSSSLRSNYVSEVKHMKSSRWRGRGVGRDGGGGGILKTRNNDISISTPRAPAGLLPGLSSVFHQPICPTLIYRRGARSPFMEE